MTGGVDKTPDAISPGAESTSVQVYLAYEKTPTPLGPL